MLGIIAITFAIKPEMKFLKKITVEVIPAGKLKKFLQSLYENFVIELINLKIEDFLAESR